MSRCTQCMRPHAMLVLHLRDLLVRGECLTEVLDVHQLADLDFRVAPASESFVALPMSMKRMVLS